MNNLPNFPLRKWRDPYAGRFNQQYINFLVFHTINYCFMDGLLLLRENVWYTEAMLELFQRNWESLDHRRKLIKRMMELNLIEGNSVEEILARIKNES